MLKNGWWHGKVWSASYEVWKDLITAAVDLGEPSPASAIERPALDPVVDLIDVGGEIVLPMPAGPLRAMLVQSLDFHFLVRPRCLERKHFAAESDEVADRATRQQSFLYVTTALFDWKPGSYYRLLLSKFPTSKYFQHDHVIVDIRNRHVIFHSRYLWRGAGHPP